MTLHGRLHLAGVLLLLTTSVARANHEETEERLKTAGVPAELRGRIHRAIDRGVHYLRSRQRDDGAFPYGRYWMNHPQAQTALGVLALRHAGTPEAMRGVEPAMRILFPPRAKAREELRDQVYLAGIALMLLQAADGPEEHARQIGDALAGGLFHPRAWWGYYTSPPAPAAADWANLSTAQFGALGLWAAARHGVRVDPEVWREHLTAILATQTASGSWAYYPRAPIVGKGYPVGTCMGLANLLLAREALREELRADPGLGRRVEAARRHGLASLERSGPEVLSLFRQAVTRHPPRLMWPYYALYALEKVCVFADLESVGGVRWYDVGAELLLRCQLKDGSWGRRFVPPKGAVGPWRGDVAGTSFALLFLLRASRTYHPTTPRPVDRRTATPAPDAPPAREPPPAAPPAEGARVELELARMILDRLRHLLRQPEPLVPELLSALRLVETAYHHLVPDAGEPDGAAAFVKARDRFRGDAERVVVEALTTHRIPRVERVNLRSDVNREAAHILSGFRADVAPALVRALERELFEARWAVEEGIWFAAFEALRKLAPARSLEWLTKEAVSGDLRPQELRRTRAALDVLGGWGEAPRRERLAAARRLALALEETEQTAMHQEQRVREFHPYWTELRPSVALALRALVPEAEAKDVHRARTFLAWLSRR
jgi:hypothetical protein